MASLWPRNLLPKHHTYQESSASEIEGQRARCAPKHPTSSRDDGGRIYVGDQSFRKPRAQRFLHEHQNRIYIYLENHDNIFCHGFGHVFLSVTFFPKYGHVRLQTLYLQDNRFPELLDLSEWFRQYECLV